MKLEENAKISVKEKLAYALGSGANSPYGTIIGSFLLAYYTDTLLINAAAISTMFIVIKILDLWSDFVVGALVDKTHTRLGKVRPWLLAASPMMAIAFILLFCGNPEWSDSGKLIYAYLTYIFANVIAYTMYNISQASILSKITMNSNERMSLSTWGNIANNIGSIIIAAVFLPVVTAIGWLSAAILFGIICGMMIFIEFIFIKERVGVEVDCTPAERIPIGQAIKAVLKNRSFILFLILSMIIFLMQVNYQQAMVFYCNNVLNDPTFFSVLSLVKFPTLIILFVVPFLAKKFSKHKLMLLFTVLTILSFVVLGIAGTNRMLLMLGVLFNSIMMNPLYILIPVFLADFIDLNEYESGTRNAGIISSAQSIGMKAGVALGGALTGWILSWFQYDGASVAQSTLALFGIKFAFGWSNAILCAVAFIALLFLGNVEKKLPEIKEELRKRHEMKELNSKSN